MNVKLFQIGFIPIGLIDILDIILVTFVLFKFYMVMRRTRAIQMFLGLLLIFLVSFIAQAFNMQELSWIFKNFSRFGAFALVILFQPELRRILTIMGQSRFIQFFTKGQTNVIIEEIVRAVLELSKRGHGGLIVLVRDTGLKAIIETGVQIQALVSHQLILSIFSPKSPLHDGAIIIRNDILEAAKCILPLNSSPQLEKRWGTRHRAALGMSEESDAVIVVVSEETGTISIAENGELKSGHDSKRLYDALYQALGYGAKTAHD